MAATIFCFFAFLLNLILCVYHSVQGNAGLAIVAGACAIICWVCTMICARTI